MRLRHMTICQLTHGHGHGHLPAEVTKRTSGTKRQPVRREVPLASMARTDNKGTPLGSAK